MRVAFVGAGTGGHLYPALALAKEIKKQEADAKIIFIGRKKSLESRVLSQEKFAFKTINARSSARKISVEMICSSFYLGKGFLESLRILRRFSPKIVVGTGGYVSLPVVLAAIMLKIPVLIHEQNVIPGMANKFLSSRVRLTCLSFPASRPYFPNSAKTKVTGNPRASEVLATSREEGCKYLGLVPEKKTLLITGGSQGALKLNQVMIEALKLMVGREDLQVIYVTGERYFAEISKRIAGLGLKMISDLQVLPYVKNMPLALAAADLIVSRAGATILAEINSVGLPAILVPSPNVVNDHQVANARVLEKGKAAVVFLEKDLYPEFLVREIFNILNNKNRRQMMAEASRSMGFPQAANVIYNCIKEIVNSSTK